MPTPPVPTPDHPPNGYEWDVFLSYADGGYPGAWVRNTFHELLVNLMAAEVHNPRIFFYRQQDYGTAWEVNLQRALATSRLMVCVWSPDYFSSRWCGIELRTMLGRERSLRLASIEAPQGLVYGVRYSDGDCFGPETKGRIWLDAEQWNNPRPGFSGTNKWDDLYEATRPFARDLATHLRSLLPKWDRSWLSAAEVEGSVAGTFGEADTVPIRRVVL